MPFLIPFMPSERDALLKIKGIGPTVISRLEELGYHSLAQLGQANALEIVTKVSALTGSTCWKNSPKARQAIENAIAFAKARAQTATDPT